MKSVLKTLIAQSLGRLGYEVVRRPRPYQTVEPWFSHPEAIADDAVPDGWFSNVLHMANRHYRPERLAYRRPSYGEDARVKYVCDFLDLRGKRVLELGPFEGYHSILLDKLGVGAHVAVEWKEDNYRKCLRIKAKYGLANLAVHRQDSEALYTGRARPEFDGDFDVVFCLGVLYHLSNPAAALEWFRRLGPCLFLGTHYIEPAALERYKRSRFIENALLSHQGRTYRGWGMRNVEAAGSGPAPIGFWPYEEDLVQMLAHAGYGRIEKLGKDLHNNVPHITVLAEAG